MDYAPQEGSRRFETEGYFYPVHRHRCREQFASEYMPALAAKFDGDIIQLITILVGDVVGAAIVLVVISSAIDIFNKFRH